MTTQEVADYLGISRNRVDRLRRSAAAGFPTPLGTRAARGKPTYVWRATDVTQALRDWARDPSLLGKWSLPAQIMAVNLQLKDLRTKKPLGRYWRDPEWDGNPVT